MNIALQMAREDFPRNFCATLEHFLRWRDDRDYVVSWNGARGPNRATLFLHPRLGIACPQWTDPRHLGFIWRELKNGSTPLASLARRAYLAAHLTPGPARRLLAAHRVTIEPRPARFADGFYVPGANQLRWFDTANRRCHVAVKRGFPKRYFRAQVAVRQRPNVPAPALLNVDHDALIFCEEIVRGRADLGGSSGEKKRREDQALAALRPLAEATTETTRTSEYCATLLVAIDEHADALEAPMALTVRALSKRLAGAIGDTEMKTCIGHGDLSLGHVLVAGGETVLVDWEHAGRRQRDHDALSIQWRPQLPERFFAALGKRSLESREWLLILESLLFHTRESDNPAISGPTPGLRAFAAGLETFIRSSGMVEAP